MKKRTMMTTMIVCLVGIAFICTTAHARPRVLKVSHQFPAGDVRDRMCRLFGEMVTERTNGELKFEYYPNASLVKPKEQWDAMRHGGLDISLFPLDYASGKIPQLSITLMPCTVQNLKQAVSWRNKPIGKKIDALMLDEGVRNLCWSWIEGACGSTVRHIKYPEDAAGLKMRAAGKKYEYMLREAGASITSMPSSEIYMGLSTGVLNAVFTSAASFTSFRLYEQLKYVSVPKDYAIWYMAANITMSESIFQTLKPEHQKVLMEVGEWISGNWTAPETAKMTEEMDKAFKKAGVDIHYMTKEEFDVWKSFAQKTAWKNFAETVDGGQELLDLALQAME